METQLKPPTQPGQISAADSNRINEFQQLIKLIGAEYLRKSLTQVYFRYTRLLAEFPDNMSKETSGDLYNLSLIIEALE